MKKVIISALIGALIGGSSVFGAFHNVAFAKTEPKTNKVEPEKVVSQKTPKSDNALSILKVEVFASEDAYSTVNPEFVDFCEENATSADPRGYVTAGDIAGCIIEKEGDTEKELNIALKKALNNLSVANEIDDDEEYKDKDTKFAKLHQQWLKLRDSQCELGAKSTNHMQKGSEQYLLTQSCINYWNKQYTMFLKTI